MPNISAFLELKAACLKATLEFRRFAAVLWARRGLR